jgi:H+/Cl- antiporter ClcA
MWALEEQSRQPWDGYGLLLGRSMKFDRRLFRFWRQLPLTSPRLWTRRLAFWAGAVIVALVVIAFADLSDVAQALFSKAVSWHPLLVIVIAPCGLALSVLLTRCAFPGAQGSGIPQVLAALQMADPKLVGRVLSLFASAPARSY